jgi:hypothetical protein
MSKAPHQLITHLDCDPNGDVEIKYSYPFGPHPLREQVIRASGSEIPSEVRDCIERIHAALVRRRKILPVRLPHQEIVPTVQDGILTIVIRDQRREIPIARLYYNEIIESYSKTEKEVRMERQDFVGEDLKAWDRIRKWVNSKAWNDYKNKTKLSG